jgi:hypothetical protein
MGGGSFSADVYTSYAKKKGFLDDSGHATNKSPHELFVSKHISQALDPKKAKIRESCDSAEHPASTAIIFGLDDTGSMGFIAKAIAQQSLPILMKEVYDRKPVTDPQVMFMGINDHDYGGHFQVSQFESDIRIAEQLAELWLEGGGGGNDHESYSMAWYFAANHTKIDCWEKRKKKGFLFTIGDELPDAHLSADGIERVMGYKPQGSRSAKQLLEAAQKRYHVFHIVVLEGSYARSNPSETLTAWQSLLGEEHVIALQDHTKLAEVTVSAIQIAAGADPDEVVKSWENAAVAKAVKAATKSIKRIVEV